MSILNGNPSLTDLGLKAITRNRLQEANIYDLEDILAILDMTHQDLVKDKNIGGVVAKFTANAFIEVSLRRFGVVSQADLKDALERVQIDLRSSLFSELVAQDDEASEAFAEEENKAEDMHIEFFLDESDDDLSETFDSDAFEEDIPDLDDEGAIPLETLLIGVGVAKGLSAPPLMIDSVVDQLAEFVTDPDDEVQNLHEELSRFQSTQGEFKYWESRELSEKMLDAHATTDGLRTLVPRDVYSSAMKLGRFLEKYKNSHSNYYMLEWKRARDNKNSFCLIRKEEGTALDLAPETLDRVVAHYIKMHGWPVDASIYIPVQYTQRYANIVAELSRIAEVVLTQTF
tara:strand:+ start:750 stop:1781 length:1032 start_codon:yes stop_codon:yes gene_type:complete